MNTSNADESAVILTNKLKAREPFVFTKFGDGDLYWMSGNPVPIAGGESYRPGIDAELRQAARTLAGLPHVYFGDQLTCGSGPYLKTEQDALRYRHTPGANYRYDDIPDSRWLHFECLLIHRLSPELLEFYRVLKARERKLFIGGTHLLDAAKWLGCDPQGWILPVHPSNAHCQALTGLIEFLLYGTTVESWDVVLLSAGRASKMIAAALASKFPDRTIIELGSALDPLFVGRTRSEQVEPEAAREYFKELL
jgi:hypothetical protein